MNSFTLVGVGDLARNPEVTSRANVPFVRFCLVGFDLAEPDDVLDRTRGVVTAIWFLAFDEIGDDIARNARKGDQLIVTARVRPYVGPDELGDRHYENEFIVTGFRYGAKRGPGSSAASALRRPPISPSDLATEASNHRGSGRDSLSGR